MDTIDMLLNVYKKLMPETVYLVKNKERYPNIEKTVKAISDMVFNIDEEAMIKVSPDELTGTSLCMEIVTNLFVIDDIDEFCEVLKEATTFEATPFTNGKLHIGFTFEDAWLPAPPVK